LGAVIIVYGLYLVIGAGAGILGGLLGIGGGVVTVPCLLFLFSLLDFPQAYLMHMAVATSLSAMVFNTAAATIAHNKRKGVVWDVFWKLAPGLIVGSALGALIGTALSDVVLQLFFGFFLIALAIYFYRQKVVKVEAHALPRPLVLNLLSGGIGVLSNVLGIGGGSLTVPMLTSYKMQDKNAIGTSAATTLITALLGSISYLILGWGETNVAYTFGFIHIPAFLAVGLAAFVMAPYGAKLTREIDPVKVRRIFAIVLALTGLSLII
jgi:uncharacterized protein